MKKNVRKTLAVLATTALLSLAVLAEDDVQALMARPDDELTVDVAARALRTPDGRVYAFPLDAFAQTCLLQGVDELGYLAARLPASVEVDDLIQAGMMGLIERVFNRMKHHRKAVTRYDRLDETFLPNLQLILIAIYLKKHSQKPN